MFYDVTLAIHYDYDQPSDHARMLMRLIPGDIDREQRVLSRLLTLDPMPAERHDGRDFFGNVTTSVTWHAPMSSVEIALQARVERLAPPPRLDLSPPLDRLARELAESRSLAAEAPHHFTGPSRRAGPTPAMTAYARAALAPRMTALAAVEAVGQALHRDMSFDAEATDVDTPAAEAFANLHGVCQDFSHVMISCLRGIGIPAGYASGFLRTDPPPGKPRLEGADAMHAWVRAWVGAELGWVEFDPTNAIAAGTDHIRLAVGRDYDDVAPVRGAMRGGAGQETGHSVDVILL